MSGRDSVPPGWGPMCTSPLEDVPGAEWQDSALVVEESGATLEGDPAKVEDPSITSTNVFDWGGVDYDDLVAMASIVIPSADVPASDIQPLVVGGVCDVTSWKNWGAPLDPASPCFDHFPIIHRPGPLTIGSGTGGGQGTLLVDGELTINGDFHFYGLIMVKGEIQLKGQAELFGAVISGGQLQMEPGDRIQYSECVVNRVQSGGSSAGAAPLKSRAWLQLN